MNIVSSGTFALALWMTAWAAGDAAAQDPPHAQAEAGQRPASASSSSSAQAEEPQPAPATVPPGGARSGAGADGNDGEGDDGGDAHRVRVNATAKLALPAGTIQVIHPLLPADGPDAEAIAALEDGDVLQLTGAMAVKLKTEVEMRFDGGMVARPENVAPGYPGVYSLWLRKRGDDWSLVLNREPDIWGTMRDPETDVGEAPVLYRLDQAAPAPVFAVTLLESNGGGQLTIAWGAHRWSAEFEAGPGMAVPSAESR